MADTGSTNGGTFANTGTGFDYSNPGNAELSDNNYALITWDEMVGSSKYLTVTNFGFSIPAGATINGIVVTIERGTTGSNATFVDEEIRLVKGGTVQGDDKSKVPQWSTSGETIETYGGSSDLWGLTLSEADVEASNFGVVCKHEQTDDPAAGVETSAVDHIAMTVYYTESGGGTGFQINISDTWKPVEAMQINIGDVWKAVEGAQINIGDTWKTIF